MDRNRETLFSTQHNRILLLAKYLRKGGGWTDRCGTTMQSQFAMELEQIFLSEKTWFDSTRIPSIRCYGDKKVDIYFPLV